MAVLHRAALKTQLVWIDGHHHTLQTLSNVHATSGNPSSVLALSLVVRILKAVIVVVVDIYVVVELVKVVVVSESSIVLMVNLVVLVFMIVVVNVFFGTTSCNHGDL